MPRFYFAVRDGDKLISDDEGLEFADLGAAILEARECATDLLGACLRNRIPTQDIAIELSGEDGALVERIPILSVEISTIGRQPGASAFWPRD